MKEYRRKTQRAFTLIEAMITMMVVALLLTLALSSYSTYMIRTHRSDGIDAAMTASVCQERIYTRTNAYDADECEGLTTNGFYNITVVTQNSDQQFTITAVPQSAQTADTCGSLSVDQTGTRLANGLGGNAVARCWSGKSYIPP
jgi:type IV pilus assembly protein PilE